MRLGMLKIDIRVGESIRVGDATLVLEKKSGQRARLAIRAPGDVKISVVKTDQREVVATD